MKPSSAPFVPAFGTGAPGASVPTNQLYFDTSSSPYTGYVFRGGLWHTFATNAGGGANATFIQGVPVSAAAPSSGQVLQISGGTWSPLSVVPTAKVEQFAAVDAGNHTIADGTGFMRLNIAAASLTNFALKMPPNPTDGQMIIWNVQKLIAALALSGNTGQTITGVTAPAPGANQFGILVYDLATTTWFSPAAAI